MADNESLAEQVEAYQNHLRAVAYRMLGSGSEADDAVQTAASNRARGARALASEIRGARAVAATFKGSAAGAQAALVNRRAGAVWAPGGKPRAVFDFTVSRGKIVEISVLMEPARLRQLELMILAE